MTYITRFRAYQLGSAGSLFSYYKPGEFTLIEARLPKAGLSVIVKEMLNCGTGTLNTLHISSWDTDHCNYDDLLDILNQLRPNRIEVPSYEPTSEMGKLSKNTLEGYVDIHGRHLTYLDESFMDMLDRADRWGIDHVFYRSAYHSQNHNDMSLIKLFRSQGFNVASFGDCESREISDRISFDGSILCSEMDVMILAHHGANNGFTNIDFLRKTAPTFAICTSNYDNQFEHPKIEVRQMLHDLRIPLFTTKTGDVIVYQQSGVPEGYVFNLISDNEKLSSKYRFTPKRISPI